MRQFNDTVREIYALTPGELRTARPGGSSRHGSVGTADGGGGVPLRLAHRGPYAAAGIFDHLAARALTGVEEMAGEPGDRTYRRTLDLPNGTGIAEVGERTGDGWLECRLHLGDLRDLTTATQRMRRLFDLDADPDAVAERLGADPALAPLVA
ncbi:AraC family transcriptional regulator, partial [Streptomyces sp. FT05W]